MKIIIVSTVHPENDVRVYYKEALSLAKTNEVILITQRYTDLKFNKVHYIPLKRTTNRVKRLLLQKEVYGLIKKHNPDVLHFHDPELIFLALLCKTQGYKTVWDVHEDLPKQIFKKHWIHPTLRKTASTVSQIVEKLMVKHLDVVIAATPSIASKYTNKTVAIVRNYPLLSEFTSTNTRKITIPTFVYVGGLSVERGFKEALEAIKIVSETCEVKLDLAGKFTDEQLKKLLPTNDNRIVYHDWLNREEISTLISNSLAGLVALHPSPNHIESLPIKMFEYMASGKALIASDFPLWREIIEKYKCGLLVDPLNPASISEAMLFLIENPDESQKMGERGRQAIEQELNWESEFLNLDQVYRNLSKGSDI